MFLKKGVKWFYIKINKINNVQPSKKVQGGRYMHAAKGLQFALEEGRSNRKEPFPEEKTLRIRKLARGVSHHSFQKQGRSKKKTVNQH